MLCVVESVREGFSVFERVSVRFIMFECVCV